MNNRFYKFLKFLIGWPFSILALAFIVQLIIPQTNLILTQIRNINIYFLAIGINSFISFYFLRAYVWHRLLKNFSYNIPFQNSCFLWETSELKRYIPGNIWSFLGRTVLFAEHGVAKKDIGICLLLEAQFFVVSSGLVSLLSLPFLALHFIPQQIVPLIIALILIGVLVYVFNHLFVSFIPGKIGVILKHVFPRFNPVEIMFILLISSIALVLFGLANYFVIVSIAPLSVPLTFALSGYFVLSLLIGYLSILTPAGFGVREGIMIAGLTKSVSFNLAAFLSLFNRIILILSELIFFSLAYPWHKAKGKNFHLVQNFAYKYRYEIFLFILALIYTIYFTTTTFLRYDNFYAGRFDLGNMAQTVWNTTRGRIFELTNPNGTEMISRLAFHADFILILLAPFYMLWANPKILLLIQTIVLAAGSFFVYFLARDILKNKNIAFIFAFAYLINPSIERTNLYDFHAVTLATTFLLAAYYFLRAKKYIIFLIFAFLAAICKEHIWLIIGLFGGILFIWHKKRMFGALLFLISIFLFFFFISYAIPHVLGSQHFALSYYSDFGDKPSKIIRNILFSPQKSLGTIFQHDQILYLKQLFAPLGYLSLLFPFILIFTAPDMIINLLSNNAQLHQIYYQYTATITPFIFIAAMYGVSILSSRSLIPDSLFIIQKLRFNLATLIIIYLLFTSLFTAYLYGPLPGSVDANLDMITKPVTDKDFIDNYLAHIPRSFSVAASNNIGSHLSERRRIYTLPLGIDKADIVVFLLNDSEYPESRKAEIQQVQRLRTDPNYRLILEKGDFIVFKKVPILSLGVANNR